VALLADRSLVSSFVDQGIEMWLVQGTCVHVMAPHGGCSFTEASGPYLHVPGIIQVPEASSFGVRHRRGPMGLAVFLRNVNGG
jgi:hypothetical protein